MYTDIEDFRTGWFGVRIGIKEREIDEFISALQILKQRKDHFHLRSDYEGPGGIADIEVYLQAQNVMNNMELAISPPIWPTKKDT